jgi:hypothetical protein
LKASEPTPGTTMTARLAYWSVLANCTLTAREPLERTSGSRI